MNTTETTTKLAHEVSEGDIIEFNGERLPVLSIVRRSAGSVSATGSPTTETRTGLVVTDARHGIGPSFGPGEIVEVFA